ncbi:MAG: SHOCT domain-containing protein [Thermoproteota archaeon]|nr:SHOCT domain-containing protein [Thermoproteota archaeon]
MREFADKEIDELRKNPQGYIQEEYIDTVLGNNPALKLIYTDARLINDKPDAVYREMIVWTKFGKMIYEVRYLAKKSEYLEHKPLVEHIMNSFQIIDEGSESKIEKERTIDTVNNEDPVLILKRRFARGEITETDYQRMKRILES